MNYAKKSDAKEFIIGTEISIVEHLQYECPETELIAGLTAVKYLFFAQSVALSLLVAPAYTAIIAVVFAVA